MLPVHPLAGIFPPLRDAELAELAADIRACGLRERIKLLDGMILDGRNRYRAALAAGIVAEADDPADRPALFERFVAEVDGDPLAYVISRNLKRRHLDTNQRAAVAAKITTLKLGDNQHGAGKREGVQICTPSPSAGQDSADGAPAAAQDAPPPAAAATPVSAAAAAAMMNVARRTVFAAKQVYETGAPELQQALESGAVSTAAAADVATLPLAEQRDIVAQGEQQILAAAREIRAKKNEVRRAERVEKIKQIAAGGSALPTLRKFPVLYIDPPTRFAAGDSDRSTENHYPTMTEAELSALPVGDLATPAAVLFCWTTVPWLAKTLRLIEAAWGFDYVSEFVWDKEAIGLGFWNRNQHESLLVATRGGMPAPAREKLRRSLHSELRGAHSRKPDYFRALIADYYPDLPRIELFARGALPDGWEGWGNEAEIRNGSGAAEAMAAAAAEPAPSSRATCAGSPLDGDASPAARHAAPLHDADAGAGGDDNLDIPDFLRRPATGAAPC